MRATGSFNSDVAVRSVGYAALLLSLPLKDQHSFLVKGWEDKKTYGEGFGFRAGSKVCQLVNWLREEHREKYGQDYLLVRHGKGKVTAVLRYDSSEVYREGARLLGLKINIQILKAHHEDKQHM